MKAALTYLGLTESQMEGQDPADVIELAVMYHRAFGDNRELARQLITDQDLNLGGKSPLEYIQNGGAIQDVLSAQIRMLT